MEELDWADKDGADVVAADVLLLGLTDGEAELSESAKIKRLIRNRRDWELKS